MNMNDILTGFFSNELRKQRIYSEIATIISIDEDNMECEVSFISSNAEKTVRLGATISEDATALDLSSIVILPEVDSKVIVTFINEVTGFVSSVTDVSKILNKVGDRYIQIESDFIEIGGDTDFMVRFSELETAYNQLKDDHDALVSTFNAHIHITTATVGATPIPGVIAPTTTMEVPSTGDISGAKIDEIKTI